MRERRGRKVERPTGDADARERHLVEHGHVVRWVHRDEREAGRVARPAEGEEPRGALIPIGGRQYEKAPP